MLLDKLNASQPLFTIFEIQAPIPSGLLKTPAGMAEWAARHLERPLTKNERSGLKPQFIADDFFLAAEDVRTNLGLHLIVGMTPAMVAAVSHDKVLWNLFSSVSGKTILLSTADLRQFAEQAGRPFKAAIGAILVAALLVAVNSKMKYHKKDSGCVFDYNGSRVSLVETIRAMQIERSCLEKLTSDQQEAGVSMLAALKRMKRKSK